VSRLSVREGQPTSRFVVGLAEWQQYLPIRGRGEGLPGRIDSPKVKVLACKE